MVKWKKGPFPSGESISDGEDRVLTQMAVSMVRISKEIDKIFLQEMKKCGGAGKDLEKQAFMCALSFSPISFLFNVFEGMHELGLNPNEEFPDVIKVYKNYLRTLVTLDDSYRTLPWNEFLEKFNETFSKNYGAVWTRDDSVDDSIA